jgi:site-specific recombinase XerD
LTHLATDRKVSASTHNQALSAILFLYRKVLAIELPWLNGINHPTQKRRIPSVLTKDEVAGLLAQMDGVTALIARLLYGTDMRLMEGMRLRINDVEFVGLVLDISITHFLPRICCSRAQTSEQCKNCWAIQTCPPP